MQPITSFKIDQKKIISIKTALIWIVPKRITFFPGKISCTILKIFGLNKWNYSDGIIKIIIWRRNVVLFLFQDIVTLASKGRTCNFTNWQVRQFYMHSFLYANMIVNNIYSLVIHQVSLKEKSQPPYSPGSLQKKEVGPGVAASTSEIAGSLAALAFRF